MFHLIVVNCSHSLNNYYSKFPDCSSHLIFRTVLSVRYCYYLPFTAGKPEIERGCKNLPKVIPFMSDRSLIPWTSRWKKPGENQACSQISQTPDRSPWVNNDPGLHRSSPSIMKKLPFDFPFSESFILGRICTFIIIKPSMKQGAKKQIHSYELDPFPFALKNILGSLFFFLCVQEISKCQDREWIR